MNSAAALRALDSIDVLAFETHGTITTGEHRLSESVLLGGRTQKDLLRAAASLAFQSRDRVLGSIEAHAPKPMPLIEDRIEEFRGISARVDGGSVLLGHPEWMKSRGIALDDVEEDVAGFIVTGRSVRVLAIDGQVAGALAFREELRPDARDELERIRTLRLPLQLLSEADDAALNALGSAVGVEGRFAGSPEAQRSEITRLRRQGRGVALLTTEPAGTVASAADVAIVLGDTPFADLAVRDLGAAATASEISHATSRAIRSITRTSVIWHFIALPIAAFPASTIWPAVSAAGGCAALAFALWSACRRRLPQGVSER